MTTRRRLHGIAVATTAILFWGCGSAAPQSSTAAGKPTAKPTASPSQPTASGTGPESTLADPTPSESPIDEGDPPGLDTLLGVTIVTVSDRIRVRSEPRISDDSIKYEPLLSRGTSLYAFNGPVYESGYEWYEVASVSVGLAAPGCDQAQVACRTIYTGWAARQGRDGELWLASGDAQCPAVPIDVPSILAATEGARLACFPRVPITFGARIIECNCDVDGGGFEPSWFGGGDQPLLLVEPSETRAAAEYDDWLIVRLDPAGRYPAALPVGQIVKVTGMFDHPDAQVCRYQGVPIETAGPPTPSSACRFMFVTTSIAPMAS